MATPPFLLVAYVRRSPRRDQVKEEFSHPFRREVGGRPVFFAHDGAIEGYEVREGRTDSLVVLDCLLDRLGPGPRPEAGPCVPYFALHEATREGLGIVCSEVLAGFEGKWRLLRNGEFLLVPARS